MRFALTFLFVLGAAAVAQATPHDLPFTYPYATLGKGQLEIEQYTDLSPVPGTNFSSASESTTVPTLSAVLTTEIEYGLTDKLELGLYFQLANDPYTGLSNGFSLGFNGIEQRLRYRLAEAGQWPVDVSLYLEIAEFVTEFEVEAKVNLERRFGRLRLLTNLWFEHEFYYDGNEEWVVNPTAGVVYEITPAIHVGIEYWMHGEYGGQASANPDNNNVQLHAYIGPALSIQGPRFWCTVAPYIRLDNWNEQLTQLDQYGQFWIRMVMGFEAW